MTWSLQESTTKALQILTRGIVEGKGLGKIASDIADYGITIGVTNAKGGGSEDFKSREELEAYIVECILNGFNEPMRRLMGYAVHAAIGFGMTEARMTYEA